ncbi:MAG: hypothetical protein HWQ38_18920 [Nostoc sp. NMS7]|uniref:hypothetical protein n=1 Tax=Nostoc sp. NMS7 TaxID=2815391 RepID=UPI0025E61A6B|nr:hypothetical protein [Nostoc sp. NMS7]MBN3948409.1 hypothetical protein [Nostoc sp. NMS7]
MSKFVNHLSLRVLCDVLYYCDRTKDNPWTADVGSGADTQETFRYSGKPDSAIAQNTRHFSAKEKD